MARKDYTPEQVIGMLREAEVAAEPGREDVGKIFVVVWGSPIAELLSLAARLWRPESRSGASVEGP